MLYVIRDYIGLINQILENIPRLRRGFLFLFADKLNITGEARELTAFYG
jgi:hypothetical protein